LIDRTKKLPARFYLKELPAADRHTVGKDIQKVEFGWPLGRRIALRSTRACGNGVRFTWRW
jgi:hypothetical protein